jgi:hypothetical protein
MSARSSSSSPTVVLRISNGTFHTHRAFCEFGQALKSAEAYSEAGYSVMMVSATGRVLFGFEPQARRVAV